MFDWINEIGLSAERFARMGRAVGADMGRALDAGQVRPETLRVAVARCHGCSRGEDCDRLLDAAQAPLAHPPGYCRNAALLDALAP